MAAGIVVVEGTLAEAVTAAPAGGGIAGLAGEGNFVVEIKEIFSLADLQLIRPGCTVRVKYKPGSNQDIILVRAA